MDAKPTDEELLSAFVSGEQEALGELARRHESALLGLAGGLLGGPALACDAVQVAWIRVIRHGHSFNGQSSFKTWLYRIAINRCRDLRARSRPVRRDEPPAPTATPGGKPDEKTLDRERNASLHQAVDRLSAPKREVVLLCYHEGITLEQAAEILAVPLGTVKSRLHGALEDLRKRLSDEARS